MTASHLQISSLPSPPKRPQLLWPGIIQSPSSPIKLYGLTSCSTASVKLIDLRSILINSSHHLLCQPASFTAAASFVISRTSIVPKSVHHTFSSSAKDTHPPLVYLRELHHRRLFQVELVLSSSPNRLAHVLSLAASAVHRRAASVLDLKRDRHQWPTSMVPISIFDGGNMLFIPSIDHVLLKLKRNMDFLRRRFY